MFFFFFISSADVFDNSGATPFQVLGTVPNLLPPARTVDCETTNNTDLADRVMDDIEANTTVATTRADDSVSNALIANDTCPIPPPNSVAGASGDSVVPENPDPQDASETADNGDIGGATRSSTITEVRNKRYMRIQKMVPGIATTARFEVRSPHGSRATNCHCRNFCAIDWCALHPEGTVGQFNLHFDNLPAEEAEVCTFNFHTRASMSTDVILEIQTKRKRRREGSSGGEYNTSTVGVRF